jgi:ABC-type nitrate/sulfonate/bicarbonate transport system ATPase subunit
MSHDRVEPQPNEAPLLELRAVAASYIDDGARLPVLANVSLAVAAGEFVAIIGPSGSGKSTLLDAIAGLVQPDSGEILLAGLAASTTGRLGQFAYMFQHDLLLPWRTVAGNAALSLEVDGVSRKDARKQARARLAEFGLAGFADSYPAQLSGGMRQRVAFLRTMLAGRPLILLDEPFGDLDALTRTAMQDWLLARLSAERRTLVFVTHDVEEALYLADRVVVLSDRPARVTHIERVTLPRVRTRSMVTSPPFLVHKTRLLQELGLLSNSVAV